MNPSSHAFSAPIAERRLQIVLKRNDIGLYSLSYIVVHENINNVGLGGQPFGTPANVRMILCVLCFFLLSSIGSSNGRTMIFRPGGSVSLISFLRMSRGMTSYAFLKCKGAARGRFSEVC